jgi:hypothetical protein
MNDVRLISVIRAVRLATSGFKSPGGPSEVWEGRATNSLAEREQVAAASGQTRGGGDPTRVEEVPASN